MNCGQTKYVRLIQDLRSSSRLHRTLSSSFPSLAASPSVSEQRDSPQQVKETETNRPRSSLGKAETRVCESLRGA